MSDYTAEYPPQAYIKHTYSFTVKEVLLLLKQKALDDGHTVPTSNRIEIRGFGDWREIENRKVIVDLYEPTS
jgi:hypothetical protein